MQDAVTDSSWKRVFGDYEFGSNDQKRCYHPALSQA